MAKKKKLLNKNDYRLEFVIISFSLLFLIILLTMTNKETSDKWIQKENTLIKGDIILEIGDYYPYDETNNGKIKKLHDTKWKVLGLDEYNNVLIMSTSNVEMIELGDKFDSSKARSDYSSGCKTFDIIAKNYANGPDAINARSITLEDIDKITNYKREDNNEEYKFFWNKTNKPIYETNTGKSNFLKDNHNRFIWYKIQNESWNISEKVELTKDNQESKELITTYKTTWYTYEIKLKNQKVHNMLFYDENNQLSSYWLASIYSKMDNNYISYGYYSISNEKLNSIPLIYSNDMLPIQEELNKYGIRVVVTLNI